MVYGFDLDGTLDRPQLANLANLLFDLGFQVHVITAHAIGVAGYYATREAKEKKMEKLGVNYTKLHLCSGHTYSEVGMDKARVIREEGIDIMFDDSTTFCNVMSELTEAVIMRVREPNDRRFKGVSGNART